MPFLVPKQNQDAAIIDLPLVLRCSQYYVTLYSQLLSEGGYYNPISQVRKLRFRKVESVAPDPTGNMQSSLALNAGSAAPKHHPVLLFISVYGAVYAEETSRCS